MQHYQQKAQGFFTEFKAFALKGNVIDLAVAVVIGTAFNTIVSSLVNNIIMPFVSVLSGGVNFRDLTLQVGDTAVTYGVFLQSVIDFLIIALSIFVAIKALRSMERKEEAKPEKEKVVEPSEEVKLLREIRDSLKGS
ncbi:MAG: large-conductance mechanosensitive channel protein MscL [Candidatus Paceibacterota bacterium]